MYDREKLIETLTKTEFRTLDENGKPFPPSNVIYNKISDYMLSQVSAITSKHVYTILNTNKFGIKDYVMRIFNINEAGKSVSR